MKTAREQALDLYSKFVHVIPANKEADMNKFIAIDIKAAKQCAIIAIEKELESIMWLNLLCTFDNPLKADLNLKVQELKEIREEINHL